MSARPCIPPPAPRDTEEVPAAWCVDLLEQWATEENADPLASTEPAPPPSMPGGAS